MEHIAIHDMDEWDTFANANVDALVDQYGSIETAMRHAMEGGLTIGGGAAPEFLVTFVD